VLEDEEAHVILQKAFKGDIWSCVFKGHTTVDEITKQEMQKKILLERFQEEVDMKNNSRTLVSISQTPL
jgi:hypothetical protein